MSNTASLRTGALIVSGALWSGLVVLAFTTGLKLPDIDIRLPDPPTILVVADPPPPTPTAPDPNQTAMRPTEADGPPIVITEPIAGTALEPTVLAGPSEGLVAGPPSPVITNPRWLARPGPREFERFYPARAREREKSGKVTLDCIVAANGALGCRVAREEPEGWGFGAAALRIAPFFRIAPRMEDGRASEGGTVRVDITFRLDS